MPPLVLSGPLCVRLRRFRKVATALPSAGAGPTVLQRGHCADVLIIGQGRNTSLLADLVSNGQPRWTFIQ